MSTPKNRAGKTIYVWPEQLKTNPGNKRFDYGNLDELAKSIAANGIQQSLKVRTIKGEKTDDGYPMYEIVDGHRRFKAAKKVASKMEVQDFIPIDIQDVDDKQAAITALITGENSKPLNLLEAARWVHQLITEHGMKPSEVAREIGKSPTHVTDCMILMERGTEEVFTQIEKGVITASNYLEMLKVEKPEVVDEAIEEAVKRADKKIGKSKGKVTTKDVEEVVKKPMTNKSKKVAAATGNKKEKDTTEGMDASLEKLVNLKAALKVQDAAKNEVAFGVLNALIKLCKGKAEPLDLVPLFFEEDSEAEGEVEEDVEEVEEVVKPKKKAAKVPVKEAKPAKKSSKRSKEEDTEDEPEEEDLSSLEDDLNNDLDDEIE